MYTVDPKTYLWMVEQDRERAMTQHALERAARSGGEQRPGLLRGGIAAITRLVRQAGSSATNLRLGGTHGAALDGSAGV